MHLYEAVLLHRRPPEIDVNRPVLLVRARRAPSNNRAMTRKPEPHGGRIPNGVLHAAEKLVGSHAVGVTAS